VAAVSAFALAGGASGGTSEFHVHTVNSFKAARANINLTYADTGDGATFAALRMSNGTPESPGGINGMIQVGHGSQDEWRPESGCNNMPSDFIMIESKRKSGGYLCRWFTTSDPGAAFEFKLVHTDGVGWTAYREGNQLGLPVKLGFTSGASFAVGAFVDGSDGSWPNYVWARFNTVGETQWAVTNNPSGSWTTVKGNLPLSGLATGLGGNRWYVSPRNINGQFDIININD
jgi:hypothetical protein